MRSELSVEDIKWALLIVGIGLILWEIHDFNYANQEPVNIADTGKQNIHAGMVIEGDLPCNYGIFAQATVYGNDAPDKVKYYYLIPVGDGSYMGYLSTASDENLRRQASETAQYLNGAQKTAPNSIPIHGFVRHMDSSTRTKMRNHMLSLGIPADKADTLLVDYYIQCAYFQAWKTVLIIGILMVAAGTWMILSQYVFTFRIRR